MRSYPTYDALALDLDLHFFDKAKVLNQAGNRIENGSWFVITDDGYCHLFDKDGNLDDINKITTLYEHLIRKDIKKIIIPDSVTTINENTFAACSNLTNITIPSSVTTIGFYAFYSCSSLTHITIPNSVIDMGSHVFLNCNRLTHITINNRMTGIGDCMFTNCFDLTNITIPDLATYISKYAFFNCINLMNVTIPDSIVSIGHDAFWGCKNIKNLFFKGKTLKQVKSMSDYPWGIEDVDIINAELE